MREPDITAKVALTRSEDGGRAGPILSKHFGCILVVDGASYDVRLRLQEPFAPGDRRTIEIDFLDPTSAGGMRPGVTFVLRELRHIATGVVLTIQAKHAFLVPV